MPRANSSVQVIGLDKMAKKLGAGLNIGPSSHAMIGNVINAGADYLTGLMPEDWDRPRQVDLQVTQNAGRLSVPRYPYLFFERGSAFAGSAGRSRSRKSERVFRSQALRIRPRRYLRRTKGFMRKELREHLRDIRDRAVREWTR